MGYRRPGTCPNFWEIKVPLDETMNSECEIDNDCDDDPQKKCCGSEFNGIAKCVYPVSEEVTEKPIQFQHYSIDDQPTEWNGPFEIDDQPTMYYGPFEIDDQQTEWNGPFEIDDQQTEWPFDEQ